MKIQVSVNFGRGKMEADAKLFAPKNWIYLGFVKGGRLCFDRETLEIQKGQSHRAPVVDRDELKRIAELVK